MNLWKRIKSLSPSALFRFGIWFLKNPFFILPTLRATRRTFKLCDQLFHKDHNRSNRGNAFRHALWNVLIAQKVFKIARKEEKSVLFTQKTTSLYEKVTQNSLLDREMDLHNNRMGLQWFRQLFDKNEDKIIQFLQKKTKNAQKVSKIDEIYSFPDDLVFLTE